LCSQQRRLGGQRIDWNQIEGNWKTTKDKVKEKWGQLTDDDLAQINGRCNQLEGKIRNATAWPRTRCVKMSMIGWTLSHSGWCGTT